MHILKLSAYCYPEQESSSHLTDDLYEAFAEADFYIENYVPMPTRGVSDEVRKIYKKKKDEILYNGHVIIHRFSMFREGRNPVGRAIRYVLVNTIQYWKGTHAKGVDVVLSGSTPPTQGMLCALVKKKLMKKYKRSVRMVFAIQDIFPDSMVTTGITHNESLLYKIGSRISNFAYRSADQIITISESMKRNLEEKGVPPEKIIVISNWIDADKVKYVDKSENTLFEEYSIDRNKFIVVYAGNTGASQGASVIPSAARLLEKETDIQFEIFGEGTEFSTIVRECESLSNVSVHGLLPIERVSEVYSLGDIALITCRRGVGKAGLPSKTWSIMACDTPIIASFDTDSDLEETLRSANAGECVAPEEPEALAEAIKKAYAKWKKGQYIKADTRSFVMQFADKKSCVSKYVETINDFADNGSDYRK